ncbi:MAG TPA: ATP-binding protein [Gaiellaceae bacterium]|nr:ATP-binding protein [Gaiellaceae bacterium]
MSDSSVPPRAEEIRRGVAAYRDVRRELERAVAPIATSVDGRRFVFQASLHDLPFQPGGYVVLGDGRSLGQTMTLEMTTHEGPDLALSLGEGVAGTNRVVLRAATGEGVILEGDGSSFHDLEIRPALPEEVEAWLERTRPDRASLGIGELLLAPGVAYDLDAGGFDRHTFLCGQSGSGKTYSLGLVLERLLLETALRIVVLDPNSDYVRLGRLREGRDSELGARYADAAAGVVVRTAAGEGEQRLRLALPELDPAAQAAALRLDPIADREEYAVLSAALEEWNPASLADLAADDSEGARRLVARARNLRVDRWGVWARGEAGSVLEDAVDPSVRCLVVDLGSLATPEEEALVANAVLARLWERRADREPVLVVVDEAHNVCPQEPDSDLARLATEHAVRIAAEGRKFGLYLLVSTQRPQKVHENVLTQCDNLFLMRMNSLADLGLVEEVFSFVPPSLVRRATTFRQGESLVAGKLSPHPALVRFGARLSEEGGGDVPAVWAERRADQPAVRLRAAPRGHPLA